jgi:hypothetical protein
MSWVCAKSLNDWQAEAKSLSCACLGLTDEVLASQGKGDSLLLNREWLSYAF